MVLSAVAVIGAIVVTVAGYRRFKGKESSQKDWIENNIAPFHGFGPFGWMLIPMMTLTVISMIPLPLGLLEVIAPRSAEWYREAWDLAGLDRNWGFITAALGRSAFALWGLVGFWAVYLVSMRVLATRENVQKMSHLLVVAGIALLGMLGLKIIGHPISFGSSGEMSAYHIGFPVNSNHTAGVFAVLSMVSLGSFLSRRHRDAAVRKTLWLFFYILFGAAVVLMKSRGALFAWGCGHFFVFLYAIAVGKQLKWKTGIVLLSSAVAIIAIVMMVSASTLSSIKTELAQTNITFSSVSENTDSEDVTVVATENMSKTQMYADFWQMGKDWGLSGTGRSAFSDVYPQYQGFAFKKHFRHAENEYWEIELEYGWFWGTVCILLGILGVCLFFRDYWKARDERCVMYGFLAAMLVLILQNFFDFSLRYWTTGMVFWLACGMLEGRRNRWKFGRVKEDHSGITKRRKIEYIAGHGLAAAACITAFILAYGAFDGQTQNGIRLLKHAVVSNSMNQGNAFSVLRENMTTRAGNYHVREIIAKSLVKEGISNKSERDSLWKDAGKWYASAVQKNPWNADYSIHLAKLCLATGDIPCANQYFIRTAQNDAHKTTEAMWELSSLKLEKISIPEDIEAFSALVISLMDRKRYEDAQKLITERKKTDPVYAGWLQCSLYIRLDMDEGCDQIISELDSEEMTLYHFDLKWNALTRRKQYAELFEFMDKYEDKFKDEVLYWERRLKASVLWGEVRGGDWYRDQVPLIFVKYRQLSSYSRRWRFAGEYLDAEYALKLGQHSRAVRSAKHALELRPSHRRSKEILEAAEDAQK